VCRWRVVESDGAVRAANVPHEYRYKRRERGELWRLTVGAAGRSDPGRGAHGLRIRLALGALVAAVLALPSAAVAQPAAVAGDGSLARLEGRAGCLSVAARHGCARARGLGGSGEVAVSPGGGSVYVASLGSDAVAVFRRRARAGKLRQLRGRAGCRRQRGGRGCERARALRDPAAIVVSPDGRHVYVAALRSGSIAVFARGRRTGALRQPRGRAGCVSGRPGARCGRGRALSRPSALAFSPGGRFLYAGTDAGVAVFRRNARTGRLVQLAGADGCVTAEAVEGCARGRAVALVADIAVDRGGDNLYAASSRDNAVAVFDLERGVPRQLAGAAGCIGHLGAGGCTPARTLLGASGLAASPNGGQLYAAATFNGAVAALARDRATGALSQPPGPLGCIRDGGGLDCADARHMEEPGKIELSPDGRNAYVNTLGALVVLRRNRTTGELSQLPGRAGCIADRPPFSDCTDSRGLNPVGIALSGDGRNAYISSDTGAIAVYRRAR
jgi:DNA-binding beta-propeller fold protein YncE